MSVLRHSGAGDSSCTEACSAGQTGPVLRIERKGKFQPVVKDGVSIVLEDILFIVVICLEKDGLGERILTRQFTGLHQKPAVFLRLAVQLGEIGEKAGGLHELLLSRERTEKDPVNQVVFIPKVVIKCLPSGAGAIYNVRHRDFCQRLLLRELNKCICKQPFDIDGHVRSPYLFLIEKQFTGTIEDKCQYIDNLILSVNNQTLYYECICININIFGIIKAVKRQTESYKL